MLKCRTAQEWVDAAIACGAEPLIVVPAAIDWHGNPLPSHPTGWLAMIEVNGEKYPGPCPEEITEEVFRILDSMGRVRDYPGSLSPRGLTERVASWNR